MTKNVKREGADEEWEDKEELNDEREGAEDMSEDEEEESEGEREDLSIYVKFVTNKENTRVLFAEVGSDFADALLTFLLLPLGTIVKFLNNHYSKAPVIGSLSSLYNGLENLDSIDFLHKDAKSLLLTPKGLVSKYDWPKYESGLTESTASFTISDDLRVMGGVEGSVMSTLNSLGIALIDMDGAETKDVTFDLHEILELLMSSLVARNPLTDYLLKRYVPNSPAKQGNSLNQISKKTHSINSKKMILKAMMQKSTNKLLFAQAQHDFVSFLFSLLSIPLGKVEWYLHSNTGVSAIDNLHKSIPDSMFKNSLLDLENRNMLFLPSLSHDCSDDYEKYIPLNFDPSENQSHVRGSRMYMVSDDLTVTPLSITSSVSVINKMKVPLSDVEEVELKVGLEEGLSILRAALTSTKALSKGLSKLILKNQEKQQN
ncbi:hypothetical protein AAHA92_11236 [Salvia divinorum]|uniref:Uncharacterized protein n=1 Tax=Salvia divinorum TaxID=28513 RepID=A0ABD1HGD1_SALDI